MYVEDPMSLGFYLWSVECISGRAPFRNDCASVVIMGAFPFLTVTFVIPYKCVQELATHTRGIVAPSRGEKADDWVWWGLRF